MAPKGKQAVVEPLVTRIWFMVVDHGFRCTLTKAISVSMPSGSFCEDFLTKIKTLNYEILREPGGNFQVWKLRHPRPSIDIQKEGYLTNLRRLASFEEGEQDQEQEHGQGQVQAPQGDEDEEKSKEKGKEKEKPKEKRDVACPLEPDEELSLHLKELDLPNPRGRISILVELLPAGGDNADDPHGERVLDSDLVNNYKAFFINVERFDSGNLRQSDIELNEIVEESRPPEFVTEFEERLDSRPGIAPDMRDVFRSILKPESQAAYVEPRSESETSELSWREANLAEITHSAYIASGRWEKCWKGQIGAALKEEGVNAIFFLKIAVEDPIADHITARLNANWPFHLIIHCEDIHPIHAQYRMFKPRSDFLISESFFPRLLVEVNSTAVQDWPPDLIWMLLQGAALVRFANAFLGDFKEKRDFVLIAIFVRDAGTATRYALFQTDNSQDSEAVYYHTKEFEFGTAIGRVEFTRQLYNFLHKLKPGEEGFDTRTKKELDKLCNSILKHKKEFGLKSFHARTTQGPKKKPRTGDGDGAGGSGGGGAGTIGHAELKAHGYEVTPEVVMDSHGTPLEPLFKMPAHVLTVYQPSDASNELIAKKVRKESHELKILRLLNSIQPKSENIVSLLDSFGSRDPQFTSWLILPKMDTVANYMDFAPQKLRGKVTEICWGLIKGLAHLHGLCIAHRDVKPDNLLVDQAFCLKIIDFDIALQVKDEDEEVDDHCGTTHWIAPEIEAKLVHSPVKADRWSCGRVILRLLDDLRKEDKCLRMMGKKLTAHDPKQRPTLLEWPRWLGALTLNVVNVLKAGEGKAPRPLQDGIEGNEKISKFRKVKKQRLID